MRIARALRGDDAPGGIRDRELWFRDTEARPLLHALEHAINPVSTFALHAHTKRGQIILLAHILLCPGHGNLILPGIGINPAEVLFGSLPQCFLSQPVQGVYPNAQRPRKDAREATARAGEAMASLLNTEH